MDLDTKKKQIFKLYEKYERLVEPFKEQAVCEKGCASCCIDVGSVGATTLEGFIIIDYVRGWDQQASNEINHKLQANRSEKLSRAFTRCAFLDEEQNCLIYEVRPFSCRRLYSMRRCEGQGPVVHRQAYIIGQKTEKELQQLDSEGCSGHLSFILHLLEKNRFREGYLRENWSTEKFKDIIERYELVVHRQAKREKRERETNS